jgi:hypothetical protein
LENRQKIAENSTFDRIDRLEETVNKFPGLLISFILMISPFQSFAAGEYYGRIADTASVGSCVGKLVEQIHEGGNIHGFDGVLLLACMQSETEASWVLLSGTSCYDQSDNQMKCGSRRVRSVPRIFIDEDFWKAKETPSAAYPMLYNLLKYGIGEKCQVNEQKYEVHGFYNRSVTDKYWQCKNVSIQDGIEDFARAKWKSFRLSTNSKTPIDVINSDDASTLLGTHFVLPESVYTLKIEEYQ